jgi:hypothetical protein
MNPISRYAGKAWMPSLRCKLEGLMATPILFLSSFALLTLTMTPLVFLFWLMQPATRANPGVSAYIPPSCTRVEPIARTVEPHESPREFSSATNFARDYTRSEPIKDAQMHDIKISPKREARLTHRKQSPYNRKYEQSARAYAQEWHNYGLSSYRLVLHSADHPTGNSKMKIHERRCMP